MGKKTRLYDTKVSQKCTFPSLGLNIRPNIFGNQYVIPAKIPNRLPPNRT